MRKIAFAFLVFIFLTGQIAVDQKPPPVTVADHANNTDGHIPTWDLNGVPTSFGPGTANQYVASQGAGAEPIFKSILDEDDMVSNSATDVVSQQSLVEYVTASAVANPTGAIIMYAPGVAPPSGYLLCDGAAVSRATYSDLFTAISTTYGVGDGSTTFNLPDFTDRFPLHADADAAGTNNTADTGGASTHVLTEAEMASHGHTQDAHNHTQDAHAHTTSISEQATKSSGGSNTFDTGGSIGTSSDTATNQAATATNQTTGSDSAHTNRDKFLAIPFMIKF